MIMGSRWDLLDDNRAVRRQRADAARPRTLSQGPDARPDRAVRPRSTPASKAGIYNPYTVVERRNGVLAARPLSRRATSSSSSRWRSDLREAADAIHGSAFAKFLRLRADALLTDDYYAERPRLARSARSEIRRHLRALRNLPRRSAGREDVLRRLDPDPQRGREPQAGRLPEIRARHPGRAAARRRRPAVEARASRRRWK